MFVKGDRVKGKVTHRIGTFVDYLTDRTTGKKSKRAHIVKWDGEREHSIAFRIERYNGDQT